MFAGERGARSRPTHELVVVADGVQERVDLISAPEQRLLGTMAEMRAFSPEDLEPGLRWIARKLRASAHEVRVANSRGPESLGDLAAETGATAVTAAEVAAGVDVLIVSVP